MSKDEDSGDKENFTFENLNGNELCARADIAIQNSNEEDQDVFTCAQSSQRSILKSTKKATVSWKTQDMEISRSFFPGGNISQY